MESTELQRPHAMFSSHADAVAVRSSTCTQNLGSLGWASPGLAAQLPESGGLPFTHAGTQRQQGMKDYTKKTGKIYHRKAPHASGIDGMSLLGQHVH